MSLPCYLKKFNVSRLKAAPVRFGLCVDYARKEKSGKSELMEGLRNDKLLILNDGQPWKSISRRTAGILIASLWVASKSFTSRELFLTERVTFSNSLESVRSNTNQLINTKISSSSFLFHDGFFVLAVCVSLPAWRWGHGVVCGVGAAAGRRWARRRLHGSDLSLQAWGLYRQRVGKGSRLIVASSLARRCRQDRPARKQWEFSERRWSTE